jgi:hypothetical protein
VLHPGQNFALCRSIALQLVRHDHPRDVLSALQQLAEEPLGRLCAPLALQQDVEHDTVLIDRPPKVMLLAANADEYLIHVSFVARPWPTPLQSIGKQPAEAQSPLANSLVADHDTSGRQDQLNIPQAQAQAVIQPHWMLGDLDWVPEATIRVRRGRHARQVATAPTAPPT